MKPHYLIVLIVLGLCSHLASFSKTESSRVQFDFSNPTADNSISSEEITAFFTEFKEFCKNRKKSDVKSFVNDPLIYETYNGSDTIPVQKEVYTIKQIKEKLAETNLTTMLIPEWNNKIDSVLIGQPAQETFADKNYHLWSFSENNQVEDEYVFLDLKSGYGGHLIIYHFRKIEGIIKMYKITASV